MSTLTRFVFIAVALLGTVSAASAAPRHRADSYAQSDQFHSERSTVSIEPLTCRTDPLQTRGARLKPRGKSFPLGFNVYFALPQLSAVSGVHTSTPVTIIGSSFLPAKTSTRDFTAV